MRILLQITSWSPLRLPFEIPNTTQNFLPEQLQHFVFKWHQWKLFWKFLPELHRKLRELRFLSESPVTVCGAIHEFLKKKIVKKRIHQKECLRKLHLQYLREILSEFLWKFDSELPVSECFQKVVPDFVNPK